MAPRQRGVVVVGGWVGSALGASRCVFTLRAVHGRLGTCTCDLLQAASVRVRMHVLQRRALSSHGIAFYAGYCSGRGVAFERIHDHCDREYRSWYSYSTQLFNANANA